MKIDEIKTIVKLMSEHDLTEFKIEAEEMRLCIKRGATEGVSVIAAPQVVHSSIPAAPAVSAPATVESTKSAVAVNTIDAPIVGTFYRSPSPDTPSFVKPGDKVQPDSVVCIIEAMKVMNEIKAEKSGVIKEILVENSSPVEYGQPLFVIE
ncbi:MAG: acetyl-CoA carboxylase, biotin carboxyl carrier protein [Lentisphaerae bacterium GWF2_45_14]|nr:MAG: acetyl-CoA carboxylase, biotin carboxyl carrier protein [Lentisphaerae bacterium GWF2_45_14]